MIKQCLSTVSVFSIIEITQINQALADYHGRRGGQMVVVTLDSGFWSGFVFWSNQSLLLLNKKVYLHDASLHLTRSKKRLLGTVYKIITPKILSFVLFGVNNNAPSHLLATKI